MGVQVPPLKLRAKHKVVIQLTGRLTRADAKALKKDLDRVLDKYRDKCGGVTPPPPKRRTSAKKS